MAREVKNIRLILTSISVLAAGCGASQERQATLADSTIASREHASHASRQVTEDERHASQSDSNEPEIDGVVLWSSVGIRADSTPQYAHIVAVDSLIRPTEFVLWPELGTSASFDIYYFPESILLSMNELVEAIRDAPPGQAVIAVDALKATITGVGVRTLTVEECDAIVRLLGSPERP